MIPYLLVDGARVVPESVVKPHLAFRLRLPAQEIRLISGSAYPSELVGSPDTRRLGVGVREIRWVHEDEAIDVPVSSPGFADGFHGFEERAYGPVRWTMGDAALPPVLFPPWRGEVRLYLMLEEWLGSALEPPVTAAAQLLCGFESLGEDCEFGLVQRHYLVEPPLSLYRWAGAPAERLIEALDSRFASLADPASTRLVWDGREYFLCAPFVTMHTKCNEQRDAAGIEELLRCGRATLRILCRKLLKDIADARRIFVFKSMKPAFDEAGMRRLHAALRRIGPARLLCVREARSGQTIGGAERLGDGLYVGYVEKFVIPRGPVEPWLSICKATLDLHAGDLHAGDLQAGDLQAGG